MNPINLTKNHFQKQQLTVTPFTCKWKSLCNQQVFCANSVAFGKRNTLY